jgi:LacI family transcriptional regulator, galactose operon repressor
VVIGVAGAARPRRHGARSFTLGLMIEDVANPFYSAIAQAVEERARERSSMLITASAREDPVRERELVTALLRRRVDALLAGDHTRIAFVGDDVRLYTAREQLAGYRKALARAGVADDPALVAVGNSTSADARKATADLMALPRARRPTAILTGDNRCTVGALHALDRKRGRTALVGFDDFELADLLEVTVIRTDPYRLGQLPAELAFDRIDGNDGNDGNDGKSRRLVVPAELVTRGSGETPA